MQNPRLAQRYAKSIMDLAVETNQLDTVFNDMQIVNTICTGNPDFVQLLKSPIIKGDTKQKIVSAIVTGKIGNLTEQFLKLLINKSRESSLPEIATAFIAMYKDKMNIQVVQLTTATPLSPEALSAIKTKVEENFDGKTIEIEASVNEALIGGFVLEVAGKQIDASIAYDLKAISKQFLNNDYIFKLK
jgi:F-type H+-transporting ATPase subunit delta